MKSAQVLNIIRKIPPGKVATYAQIARLSNQKNPRQVGSILHSNTNPNLFPCHRVIRSDGTLATGYAFGGPAQQKRLLEKEGIVFKNGRIDLNRFIWEE